MSDTGNTELTTDTAPSQPLAATASQPTAAELDTLRAQLDAADAERAELSRKLDTALTQRDNLDKELSVSESRCAWNRALSGTIGHKPIGSNPASDGQYIVTWVAPHGRMVDWALFTKGRWLNRAMHPITVVAWMSFPESYIP